MKVSVFVAMSTVVSILAWSGSLNIVNRKTIQLDKPLIWGAFNSQDSRALVLDEGGNIFLLDPVRGVVLEGSKIGSRPALADASVDLNILVAASSNGHLTIHRTDGTSASVKSRVKLKRRESLVGLKYNGLHRQVIALSSNGRVTFLSEDGENQGELSTQKQVIACTLNHKGQHLYIFHKNGTITRVNTMRRQVESTMQLGSRKEEIKVKAVALSKCARVPLTLVGIDRFDNRIQSNRNPVFSHTSDVNFANAFLDEIRVFNLETNRVEKNMEATSFRDEITDISFSPDGLWAATIHAVRKKIKLWDVKLSVEASQFESDQKPTFVNFSQRGNFLLFGDANGQVTILSLEGVAPCGSDSFSANFKQKGGLKIPNSQAVSLALMPFDVEGTSIEVGRTVTRLTETLISIAPNVTLAERSDLDRVARELKLQNTGATDVASAAQIGKILNTQYLLMGTMTRFGEKVILMLKLVEVETAKIVGTRSLTCNRCGDSQIPEAVERLCMGIFDLE